MADMTGSIPINTIVNVVPSALGTGAGVSFINGLILTQNAALPVGTLKAYTSASDVVKDFAATSVEAKMAAVYFSGYEGAQNLPSKLYFYGAGASKDASTKPADTMNAITAQTQDFTGFTTAWEPTLSDKQAFASWNASQNARYWYAPLGYR